VHSGKKDEEKNKKKKKKKKKKIKKKKNVPRMPSGMRIIVSGRSAKCGSMYGEPAPGS